MGVYIPKMTMPKDCRECRFGRLESCDIEPTIIRCIVLNKFTHEVDWHEYCPLVEVKPHGRLIDADELLKHKGDCYDAQGHLLYAVGTGNVMCAPTIIEASPTQSNASNALTNALEIDKDNSVPNKAEEEK